MLQSLKIDDFLLFKKQSIDLEGSFSVISGETGSGKSMFIKALKFVLGEKQDLPNASYSVIAEFSFSESNNKLCKLLEENGIETESSSIILRKITAEDGKTKSFVNDVPVTIKLLKSIGDELVEFHSQHKQLDAFSNKNCLSIIDQFLSEKDLLVKIEVLFNQIKEIDKNIADLVSEAEVLERDKDYISHSLAEIKALNIQKDEEEHLIERKKLFHDKAKTINFLKEILYNFDKDNSPISFLLKVQRNLGKFEHLEFLNDQIDLCLNALNELETSTQTYLKDVDQFENIEEIEERLSKIKELARKYRCTSNELVDLEENYQQKQDKIENLELYITQKNNLKNKLLEEYFYNADILSDKRKIIAKELSVKIINELSQLKLEQVELEIIINSDKLRQIGIRGVDQASFLIKTNKGFAFAPINEIASGGELSRIMLAFKVALAQNDAKTTIIFDEIDSGTGGAVAEVIGKRLKKLAETNQIIAISHQPQVASKAKQHLLINKLDARTTIINLDEKAKINEIARMLAGENITESAINAAISLISS